MIKALGKQVDYIDHEIKQLIASSPELKSKAESLENEIGVGLVTTIRHARARID